MGRAGSAWTAFICAEARGPCSLPDALGVAGKPGPGSYWLYVEPSIKPAVDCGELEWPTSRAISSTGTPEADRRLTKLCRSSRGVQSSRDAGGLADTPET